MEEIYVLDEHQTKRVMEENDVVYLSRESFSLLFKNEPESIHHLFMYVPPRPNGKNK